MFYVIAAALGVLTLATITVQLLAFGRDAWAHRTTRDARRATRSRE